MSNLYRLTNEMENLYEMLVNSAEMGMVDEETGEIDERLLTALTCKEEEFNEKAIAVATVCRRFQNTEEQIEAEIKRLTALKKNCVKVQDRLTNSLDTALQKVGKTKIDGISASIGYRKSTKTVIENENDIPEEYFNVTITKKPDLTKIKKSIQAGNEVPGAFLQELNNIQIK